MAIYRGYINWTGWLSFDPDKSIQNAAERGLPFELVEFFAWDTALIAEDLRKTYGEVRYQALGMLDAQLHMLVFTPRQNKVHVISLRRANQRERDRYAKQQAQARDNADDGSSA